MPDSILSTNLCDFSDRSVKPRVLYLPTASLAECNGVRARGDSKRSPQDAKNM